MCWKNTALTNERFWLRESSLARKLTVELSKKCQNTPNSQAQMLTNRQQIWFISQYKTSVSNIQHCVLQHTILSQVCVCACVTFQWFNCFHIRNLTYEFRHKGAARVKNHEISRQTPEFTAYANFVNSIRDFGIARVISRVIVRNNFFLRLSNGSHGDCPRVGAGEGNVQSCPLPLLIDLPGQTDSDDEAVTFALPVTTNSTFVEAGRKTERFNCRCCSEAGRGAPRSTQTARAVAVICERYIRYYIQVDWQ